MRSDKNFDESLKNSLKNVYYSESSKDIFNEAWEKSKNKSWRVRYKMLKIRKAAIAAGLSIVIVSAAVFTPAVRAAVKTFFGMNSKGQVEQQSEEDSKTVGSYLNLSYKDNKELMEELLGFKIQNPKNAGEYYLQGEPEASVNVFNVKIKDEKKITDMIDNSKDYKKTFDELSKKYKLKTQMFNLYGKMNDKKTEWISEVIVTQHKDDKDPAKHDISDETCKKEREISIDGIKCLIYSYKEPEYPEKNTKEDDGSEKSEDITTEKPVIKTVRSITWKYEGITYNVIGNDHSKIDSDTLNFVEAYIKTLKSQK